jgi:hypothetical protein
MKEDNGLMKWNIGSKSALALTMTLVMSNGIPSHAFAAIPRDRVASVRVDGMVCYFCSSGIEKVCKLKKLGKGYSTDLQRGLFNVRLAPAAQIPDPAGFERIVKGAGFTYRGVRIAVEGRVIATERKNVYGIVVPETHQVLRVEPSAGAARQMAASVNRTVRVTLQGAKKDQSGWLVVAMARGALK